MASFSTILYTPLGNQVSILSKIIDLIQLAKIKIWGDLKRGGGGGGTPATRTTIFFFTLEACYLLSS